MKNIAVIGGGYSGVLTAKHLAKLLGKGAKVTLYDKKAYHTLLTELHEVAAGRVDEDSVRIAYETIFPSCGKVAFEQKQIDKVDFAGKKIFSGSEEISYDYLVLANGCRMNYWNVAGAEEHSFPLWSYQDAVKLKEQILGCFRQAMLSNDEEEQRRLLHFVVVGAGFTGIEMAGELAEWAPSLCHKFHLKKDLVKITVVDVLPTILPVLPEPLIKKAEKDVAKLGIDVMVKAKITGVSADSITVDGKGELPSKTVIWNAGVDGKNITGDEATPSPGRGRLEVKETLQLPEYPEVFVVGDRIFFIPEGEKRPVPQMVENCEQTAPLAAHNIAAAIKGKELKPYKPHFHGMMISIGSRRGVAYVGGKNKMMIKNSFMALFIKHFINMIYITQVGGWTRFYSYLLHEFFHVPEGRNIFGGHFSKRTPNFWLVPLRLWLGASWLLEGIPKLLKLIANPKGFIIFSESMFQSGADAASSASGNAGADIEGITAAAQNGEDITEMVHSAIDSAVEAATAYGTPLHTPEFIVNMNTAVSKSMFYVESYLGGSLSGMGVFVQSSMIIAEVLIGLMLLGGFFTMPAAVVSIIMGVMIWTTGFAPVEMVWYWLAALALIGGGGSVFSMDYYLYPLLSKLWKKLPFVRNWKIYND